MKSDYLLPEITSETFIKFHDLKFADPDANGDVAIVRWSTDSTILANDITVEIILLLSKGFSAGEVQRKLHVPMSNLISIVSFLCAQGFVSYINGKKFPETKSQIHPWLPRANKKWFSWSISGPFIAAISFIIAAGIIIGIFTPGYFPSYLNYYWSDDLLLVLLVKVVLSFVVLFLHELAHFVVTKAVGGQAVIRFSNRYVYVIAETEHYHMALIQKKKKQYVYLAGIFFDLFTVALIFLLFYYWDAQAIATGVLRPILEVVVIMQLFSIAWEFSAFLETDIYNSLTELLNQPNLNVDSRKYLWNRIKKWKLQPFLLIKKVLRKTLLSQNTIGEADDLRIFSKTEKKHFLLYAVFFILGIIFTTLYYLCYTIPFDVTMLVKLVQQFSGEIYHGDFFSLVKIILSILLVLIDYILLLLIIVGREKGKRKVMR